MARVDVEDLKNLDNVEKLADIFTHRLNYQYEESVISTRRWKEDIANSILESEIKLLAKHEDFHIVYCKIESLRLGIERPIVNQLLREHPYLLVIFSDKSNQNWHFVNIKYDEEIKNRRLFRRIVIGPYERLHTAAERINKLEITDDSIGSIEVQNKHDVAFDVEEVTKEFFDKFTDIFHLLCEDIEEENPACKGDCDAQAQLILNRLMFLYFIQKKGWLNNNPQYLYENFLNYWKKDPKDSSYYSQFLLKLCQALSSQTPLYKETLGDVPFLNGGLFEIDPFTSKLPFKLHIKNSTFKNIFDELLERFNFTVREDTPLDVEVAIDPEMLGQVFENLILKLEKGEDLRQKTGSYYTPRVIVHFMCQESLKEYLITESQIEKEKIESLFKLHPADQLIEEEIKSLEKSFNIQEARLLKNLIKKAYILDPAVGSGAFLVGMLHEMISVTKLLDVRESGNDYILKKNYDYELKRELIETSLYGVDIQEQAVRICELRLWLSLIVDYERSKNQDVPPLPNLNYKIRCGDSLIERLFGHSIQLDQLDQTDKGRQLIDEIKENKEAYFLERNIQEKSRIELSNLAKQCELLELLIKVKKNSFTPSGAQGLLFDETEEERKNREAFEKTKKEYENILGLATNTRDKVEAMLKGKIPKISEDIHRLRQGLGISFIWKLDFAEVFKEKGGFDIIIGNPPYVEARNSARFPDELKDALQKTVKQTWGLDADYVTRGSDLLIYFFVKGIKLLNENGVFTFITQNSWLDTNYGFAFQKFLSKNVIILKIIDSDYKYFEYAQINTVITLFKSQLHKDKESNIITFSRYHTNLDNIYNLDSESVSIKKLTQRELTASEMKWGIYLSAPDIFFKVLEELKKHAKDISEVDEVIVTCGQGVNLDKSYYLSSEIVMKCNLDKNCLIPIMDAKDGAPFVLYKTQDHLGSYKNISADIRKELKKLGMSVFDRLDRPVPSLILPRGIGRHFCAINKCNALSSSCVDIYIQGKLVDVEKVKLQLWVFLNSSLGWFIRETSGRKNLGGGMLKAEATDLKNFPIYLDLNHKDCEKIFEIFKNREALQPLEEIQTMEHEMVDKIVFDYLSIDNITRKAFVTSLVRTISSRGERARTSGGY